MQDQPTPEFMLSLVCHSFRDSMGDFSYEVFISRLWRAWAMKAAQQRAKVLPVIVQIQSAGATTLREIAAELNAREIQTLRGGQWSAMQVSRVLRAA